MTIIFDSARLGNPTIYTGRPFGRDIPAGWPEYHSPRLFCAIPAADLVDPTDFAPAFHPSPEDDAWQAQTSPLNTEDDISRALASIHTEFDDAEADFEFFVNSPDSPESFEEFDLNPPVNGTWGGHPDRSDA